MKFLDGKRKGDVAGLQNWRYYEITNKTDTNLLITNKKIGFGIPAIQYFSEISTRLQKAELVTYAGTDSFLGQEYDLVHCTWKSLEPTKEMDQYLVWINKKTNIIDFVQYTIRDAGKFFSGTIQYDDYQTIQGIQFPMEQTVYTLKMKKNKKKHIHQLKTSNLRLDGFSPNELIIDKTVGVGADAK